MLGDMYYVDIFVIDTQQIVGREHCCTNYVSLNSEERETALGGRLHATNYV